MRYPFDDHFFKMPAGLATPRMALRKGNAISGMVTSFESSERILYLLLDYRPDCVATRGNTLAIGGGTGRIVVITFSPDVKTETILDIH